MEGAPRGIQDAISTMVVCDQLCSSSTASISPLSAVVICWAAERASAFEASLVTPAVWGVKTTLGF